MKQLSESFLIQIRSDNAQASGVIGRSGAYLRFLRNMVKLHPAAIHSRHNALGPQYIAITAFIQLFQNLRHLFPAVFVHRLRSPAGKHLICVMVMPMVIVILAATGTARAMLPMLVAMLMMVMIRGSMGMIMFTRTVLPMLVTIMLVMLMGMTATIMTMFPMLMVVTAAIMTMLPMLMLVTTAIMAMFPMLMTIMLMTAAIMTMLSMLMHRISVHVQLGMLHGREDLCSLQLRPGGGDQSGLGVVLL